MFVDVKKTIESENHSLPDKLIPPYPVDVTRQMLGCFIEKYDFPEKNFTYVDALPIGDVAEELWIYSKSVELLAEPEDASYLTTEIEEIQNNISGMLRLLKDKLSIEDIDWLVDICNDVFAGKRFDDVLFNDVIEHFAQKHVGKESLSFRD
jgi:hypothetical protein